jgi:hypothetical protein
MLPPRAAAGLAKWLEKARLADRRAMLREGRLETSEINGIRYVTRAMVSVRVACALLGTDEDTVRSLNRRKRGRLIRNDGQEFVDLARLDRTLDADHTGTHTGA